MSPDTVVAILPFALPLFFAGLWLAITSLLGLFSGWYGLARRYPDRPETASVRLGWQSGMMGPGVNMRGVLGLEACPSGLRIRIIRAFGPFCRPIFVPWREIDPTEKAMFFQNMVQLRFGGSGEGRLTISAGIWQRLSADAAKGAVPIFATMTAPARSPLATAILQWAVATVFAALFFTTASIVIGQGKPGIPIAICILFPAIAIGIGQVIRYFTGMNN